MSQSSKIMNKKDKWNSEYYKEHSDPQEQSALSVLDKIKFKGNESILDIGCGDGKITANIANRIPKGLVIGIDNSPSMIKAAKHYYANIPNLAFKLQDATNFNFDQKFDYVFSFSTFHWISDQLSALKNIQKALKPNGRVIIQMGCDEDSPVKRAFEIICSKPKWKSQFEQIKGKYHHKTAQEYQKLLDKAGFTKKNITVFYLTSTYKSFDDLAKWFMGWIPYCTGLSEEKSLAFAKEIIKNIYEQQNQPLDLPIEYYTPFLHIEAQ